MKLKKKKNQILRQKAIIKTLFHISQLHVERSFQLQSIDFTNSLTHIPPERNCQSVAEK